MTPSEAEWYVLTTAEGHALLEEVGRVERPGPADLDRWRRGATAEVVAAAVRLAECRRRGRAKFARADRMWLEPTGLEQATTELVARHKASRFAGAEVVDLCCGIGGDSLALASVARRVVAVDRDEGMTRRARWNAEVYDVANRLETIAASAESAALPPTALVHIDPDRRAGAGPRARGIAQYQPNLEFLNHLIKTTRGGAIKLGPASDFDEHFGREGVEVELISLGGECKEATAWFGSLATCRRRATALPSGASWTDRDGPAGARAGPVPLGAVVLDPDPALVRAGLVDSLAAHLGLGRVADGCDLLTGPIGVDSPWLAAFEVLEVAPLDEKRLRRLVAERGLGPLEIKPRGLDIRPEVLRPRLRPPGPNPATLLLVGGPRPGLAIVARRRSGSLPP
jgi:hypothetical protein